MQIEHITLGGSSVLRDSTAILPETVELLRAFQLRDGVRVLPFPRTSLTVKVTSSVEGAIFDVMKGEGIGVTNVCCFEDGYSAMMFAHVEQLHELFRFGDPRMPVLSTWLYSIFIDPMAMSPEEFRVAGEVELYIYYSLYLARE